MKTTATKLMVVLLSLMMTVSSFITFSFAEDPQEQTQAPEAAATAVESTPEPVKEEPPAPEPVKESTPEPEPEPEPVADNSSAGGGSPEDVTGGSNEQQDDPTPQDDVNGNGTTPEVVQNGQENGQKVPDEEPEDEEKKEDEKDKMPAQSFSGSAGGLSVKASAGQGVFPEGTKMNVSGVSSGYVMSAAEALAGENGTVVDAKAVDITFIKDGREVQPAAGSVKVSLSANGAVGGEEHEAVHISGGSASSMGDASATSASFRTDHFSIYGIIGVDYDDPDAEIKARNTYVFKVLGQEVDRQIVIDGESLTKPTDPNIATGRFRGWMIEGGSTPMSFPYMVSIPDTQTTDKEITVNALIAETFSATFWKDSNKTEILEVKEGEENEEITTGDVTWKFPDGKGITGWTLNGESVTKFNITQNVELLPVISGAVCEVSFETGEGSPVPAVFVEKGKELTKPADPVRKGYEFKGWFTDRAHMKAYDFSMAVTEDFRLYAKWEGAQTTYRIVYWQENPNDTNYTVREVVNDKSGKAGETAAYEARNYPGFTLNTAKSDEIVIIKGDGTSIKNVYYDRKTYPLTFQIYQSSWFSGSWKTVATKMYKYEQDTSEYWNQITAQYNSIKWYTSKNSNTAYQAAPVMAPANGGPLNNFAGITVYGKESSGKSYIYYLDYADKKTKIRPVYENPSEGWTHTSEDYIQIPGWTFKEVAKDYPKYENNEYGKRIYTSKLYYTRNNYKLSFDPKDGSAAITVNSIPFEAQLTGHVPTGYKVGETTKSFDGIEKTFAGWFDNQDCIGNPVDFSGMTMPALPNNNDVLEFYGKWIVETHTVSFDLDGGQFDGSASIAPQVVESGKLATAPDSEKMSKIDPEYGTMVFGGWKDESGSRFGFDSQITRDIELTAIWNTDNTKLLTIEYDVNNGTGSVSDSNKYQDGSHAIIKGQPTAPDGKYFAGWKVGSSDLIIASGSFQVNLSDADKDMVVTLTAQYADKPAHTTSVTYVLNGGKINGSTNNIVDENAVVNGNYNVISDKPAKESHTFSGWNTEADGSGTTFRSGSTVAAGRNVNILYAQYTQNKVSVDVVITGTRETKTYNGSEQEVTGFKYIVRKGSDEIKDAVDVDLKQGKSARAAGTDTGTYLMNLTEDSFDIKPKEGYEIGKVTVNDGKLVIIADTETEVVVEITGHNLTETYNNKEYSVSGYEVQINNSAYTEKDFTFSGSATAKGTEVGTYPMNLDGTQFTNISRNLTNVKFLVTDGWLKINPVPQVTKVKVVIKGNADTVTYDGKRHEVTGFDYDVEVVNHDTKTAKSGTKSTESGLKDKVSVTLKDETKAKAEGTDADTYKMGLTLEDFVVQAAEGYEVVGTPDFLDGLLKIEPYNIKVDITGNTKEVPENGKEQSVSGFKAEAQGTGHPSTFDSSKVLWKAKDGVGQTPVAKGTTPDTYYMELDAKDFSYNDKNYEVSYNVTDGWIKITQVVVEVVKVNVIISGTIGEPVMYDGNEHEVTGFDYEVEVANPDTNSAKLGTKSTEKGLKDKVSVKLKDGKTARAAGTNAGTYMMGLTADSFEVTPEEGYELASVPTVNDGKLVINPEQEKKDEVVPPSDPDNNKKGDVLGDYEDNSNNKGGVMKTADNGSSTGGGPKTGDSNRMFLYIEILSLAVISLIMLIAGRREEEESE